MFNACCRQLPCRRDPVVQTVSTTTDDCASVSAEHRTSHNQMQSHLSASCQVAHGDIGIVQACPTLQHKNTQHNQQPTNKTFTQHHI